jgi:putative FmdB family regulatory protein
MPLYDYACEDCGDFRALRPISERDRPLECPECGEPAARVLTAPQLNLMASANRIANARNEKSAHEPAVVQRVSGTERHAHAPGKHKHDKHCNHSHGKAQKSHAPPRPWMIGH